MVPTKHEHKYCREKPSSGWYDNEVDLNRCYSYVWLSFPFQALLEVGPTGVAGWQNCGHSIWKMG